MKQLKVVLLTFLSFLLIPCRGFSQDFTSGLVGYWPFCACSTTDETGNGHDGMLNDGPVCVAGIRDQAFEFDGSNWINVPYSDAFNINPDSELTLAAWVNPARVVPGLYQALVVKGTDVWDYGLYLDVSGAFMFGCQWPNHEVFSTTIPQPGTWYHVVGVYNNQDWKIYVNGKLQDELPNGSPLGQSTNPIGMGIKGIFFKDMYAGALDEVRLYNRALTDSDVAALYRSTFIGTLSLSSNEAQISAESCGPLDTAIQFGMGGCGAPTSFTLDSVWLSGSTMFSIAQAGTLPRRDFSDDSVDVEYSSTANAQDTATLHIRYHIGSGEQDTTILLIGTVSSPFLTQPTQLHREAASAYVGQYDSLTLGVDISSAINLDSLWPYITEIQATYTWDSSVAKYYSYLSPSGWSLTSLSSHGNAVDFDIQNAGSSPTEPMNLGTALFRPNTTQLATSWVTLSSLVIDIGNQALSLCVTDNEDNHWAVKTLGELSGVAEPASPPTGDGIAVYPNPAGDELFVQNANEIGIQLVMYDVIGRKVWAGSVPPSSTGPVNVESLALGTYLLVCHLGDRVITRSINKIQ